MSYCLNIPCSSTKIKSISLSFLPFLIFFIVSFSQSLRIRLTEVYHIYVRLVDRLDSPGVGHDPQGYCSVADIARVYTILVYFTRFFSEKYHGYYRLTYTLVYNIHGRTYIQVHHVWKEIHVYEDRMIFV